MRRTSRGATDGHNLTESVVQRLEEFVLTELEPGGELASEADLAEEFGVSRLTIREATRALQARGLLDIRQGRRPIVAYPSARPIGDFFTVAVRRDPRRLMDLLEVRRALEVHIAALAAAHAGRAAVAALEAALVSMRGSMTDTMAVHRADIRFHESLAAATGNQMLSFLIEAMEEPLHVSRLQSLSGHLARGGSVDDVIEQHERILDRVRHRDAKGAAAAMRAHLAQTARDLKAALAHADAVSLQLAQAQPSGAVEADSPAGADGSGSEPPDQSQSDSTISQ